MENADTGTNNDGDQCSGSKIKIKISELERELRDEKDRITVLESKTEVEKFVARQEAEKYRRDCSSLGDRVARLEEDCNILRERVMRDQEKIRGLLEEMETKEMEFKERFIELKVENRDLECGKRRAQDEVDEWRKKFFKLVAEKSRHAEMNDEMPKRSDEGFVLTPERKRSHGFVEGDGESEGEGGCDDEDHEDDGVPIGESMKKRRAGESADGVEKASDSSLNQSRGRRGASRKHSGSQGTAADVAEALTPLLPAISDQEALGISRYSKILMKVARSESKTLTRNGRPRSKKKFKTVRSRLLQQQEILFHRIAMEYTVYVIKANPEEATEGIEADIVEENTDDSIKAADTSNAHDRTAEGDADGIIKQTDPNGIETRRIPVRFRLVKRSPQKLDL